MPAFQRYLDCAEARGTLLPPWWSPETRNVCEQLAVHPDIWSNLNHAVEKHDLVEHYGNDFLMPMKLRALADAI